MTAAGGSFIDAEALTAAPALFFPCFLDSSAGEMPDAILTNSGLPGAFRYREDPRESQQVSFHQQRKSALRFGPRHLHGLNRTRRSLDAWHAGSNRRAMLEEAEVLPTALHGVVDRAQFVGFRIGEACSTLEVDDEFERFGCRIELR